MSLFSTQNQRSQYASDPDYYQGSDFILGLMGYKRNGQKSTYGKIKDVAVPIIGGAVGTVIGGPGIGTSIGASLGQAANAASNRAALGIVGGSEDSSQMIDDDLAGTLSRGQLGTSLSGIAGTVTSGIQNGTSIEKVLKDLAKAAPETLPNLASGLGSAIGATAPVSRRGRQPLYFANGGNVASPGFAKEFRKQRDLQGAGGVFSYKGSKYTTNFKEEVNPDTGGLLPNALDSAGNPDVPIADLSIIKRKKGVNLTGLNDNLATYLTSLPDKLRKSVVVTSGLDSFSVHNPRSLHRSGDALDLRFNDELYTYIQSDPLAKQLGLSTIDPNHGTAKHIHLQYKPVTRSFAEGGMVSGIPAMSGQIHVDPYLEQNQHFSRREWRQMRRMARRGFAPDRGWGFWSPFNTTGAFGKIAVPYGDTGATVVPDMTPSTLAPVVPTVLPTTTTQPNGELNSDYIRRIHSQQVGGMRFAMGGSIDPIRPRLSNVTQASSTSTLKPINPLSIPILLPEVTVKAKRNTNPFEAAGARIGEDYVNRLRSDPRYRTSPWSVGSPTDIIDPLVSYPGQVLDQATRTANNEILKPSTIIDATSVGELKAPAIAGAMLGLVGKKSVPEMVRGYKNLVKRNIQTYNMTGMSVVNNGPGMNRGGIVNAPDVGSPLNVFLPKPLKTIEPVDINADLKNLNDETTSIFRAEDKEKRLGKLAQRVRGGSSRILPGLITDAESRKLRLRPSDFSDSYRGVKDVSIIPDHARNDIMANEGFDPLGIPQDEFYKRAMTQIPVKPYGNAFDGMGVYSANSKNVVPNGYAGETGKVGTLRSQGKTIPEILGRGFRRDQPLMLNDEEKELYKSVTGSDPAEEVRIPKLYVGATQEELSHDKAVNEILRKRGVDYKLATYEDGNLHKIFINEPELKNIRDSKAIEGGRQFTSAQDVNPDLKYFKLPTDLRDTEAINNQLNKKQSVPRVINGNKPYIERYENRLTAYRNKLQEVNNKKIDLFRVDPNSGKYPYMNEYTTELTPIIGRNWRNDVNRPLQRIGATAGVAVAGTGAGYAIKKSRSQDKPAPKRRYASGGAVEPFRFSHGGETFSIDMPTDYDVYDESDKSTEDLIIMTKQGEYYGAMRIGERVMDQQSNLTMKAIMSSDAPDEKKMAALGAHVYAELKTHKTSDGTYEFAVGGEAGPIRGAYPNPNAGKKGNVTTQTRTVQLRTNQMYGKRKPLEDELVTLQANLGKETDAVAKARIQNRINSVQKDLSRLPAASSAVKPVVTRTAPVSAGVPKVASKVATTTTTTSKTSTSSSSSTKKPAPVSKPAPAVTAPPVTSKAVTSTVGPLTPGIGMNQAFDKLRADQQKGAAPQNPLMGKVAGLNADLAKSLELSKQPASTQETKQPNYLGMAMDIGRVASGAVLAGRRVKPWSLPTSYTNWQSEVENRKNEGYSQPELNQMNGQIADTYNAGVNTITQSMGAGANPVTVLAGVSRLAQIRGNQTAALSAGDAAMRRQNFGQYGQMVSQNLNLDRQQYEDAATGIINDQQAGANLALSGLQNIEQRQLFDQQYGEGSLFGKVMKNSADREREAADLLKKMRANNMATTTV